MKSKVWLLVAIIFAHVLCGLAINAQPQVPPAFRKSMLTAKQIESHLKSSLQIEELRRGTKLLSALIFIHEQLSAKGKPVTFHVDRERFKEENPCAPDVFEFGVTLKTQDKEMEAAKVLSLILEQVPTKNAAFVVRVGYVEISTKSRLQTKK